MKFTKFALASAAAFGLAGTASATNLVADGLDTWYDKAIAPTTGYNVNGGEGTTDAVWYGGSSADDTKVKAYSDEDSPAAHSGTHPGGMAAGDNFLKVSNSDPLWRMITPYDQVDGDWPASFPTSGAVEVAIPDFVLNPDAIYNGGLFVDTLVQFTPSEDVPTVEDGSKLVVWMDSNSNLCVTANAISFDNALVYTKTDFVTDKTVEVGKWYRLTVSAFNDVCYCGNGDGSGVTVHGFRVYLDGNAVVANTAPISAAAMQQSAFTTSYCYPEVIALMNQNKFFPSLDCTSSTATLSAVGFKGEGLVDDIVVTDVDPFPASPTPVGGIDFTLTWDATVSAVWYSVDGGTTKYMPASSGATVNLPNAAAGDTLTVGGTPADAWSTVAEANYTLAASGNDYTVTATAAATAGAAGVNDTALASWTPDQVKAAFGSTVAPADVNGAAAPYLDYQFGQTLNTVKGTAKLEITDIVQNATDSTKWDIKIAVVDVTTANEVETETALSIDSGTASKLNAALKIKAASTLAGVDGATAALYQVSCDSTATDLTVTVPAADGAFFKAAIDYVGAPTVQTGNEQE